MSISTEADRAAAELWKRIGKRILAARLRAGETQQQLADFLELTRPSVANLEAGRQRIPLHSLVNVATRLGTTLHDLVCETEDAR